MGGKIIQWTQATMENAEQSSNAQGTDIGYTKRVNFPLSASIIGYSAMINSSQTLVYSIYTTSNGMIYLRVKVFPNELPISTNNIYVFSLNYL